MTETEFPETPTTGTELVVRWATRDAEYAKQRAPLSPETIAAIRLTRVREAGRLPDPTERGRAFLRASTWAPPVNPEFGSIKDWLE